MHLKIPVDRASVGLAERLRNNSPLLAALIVCVAMLAVNVPIFISMPVINDVVMYDLQTRNLLAGGLLYRDILEPNLPGVVWLHVLVRSLFGFSSEAIRIADLCLVGAAVLLLARWSRQSGRSPAWQIWTAVVLFGFYFSISEWNHCQRDTWMLLAALGGLYLRRRQIARMANPDTGWRTIGGWAALEGACWAAGVWLKPMVVIMAGAVWLVSAMQLRRPKRLAVDLSGLLIAGAAVGAMGVAWLVASGAWPYFHEMLVAWNPRYFAAGKEHWTALRFASMLYRYFPWYFLHLAALPIAATNVFSGCGLPRVNPAADAEEHASALKIPSGGQRALLSALYLAWMFQSLFLQHLFDYVHCPGVLLAIAVLANVSIEWQRSPVWRWAMIGFLGVALLASPLLRFPRVAAWWDCVTQGSTPAVRDRVKLLLLPDWQDLDRVATFLQQRNVTDGELVCYSDCTIHLYETLRIRPPTRFVYVEQMLVYFPDRKDLMFTALAHSPQRFVVVDLVALGLATPTQASARVPIGATLYESFTGKFNRRYPWHLPVVFQSGTYVVLAADDHGG